METPWIAEPQLKVALQRNAAFWRNELEEYPLLWISAPGVKPGEDIPEPATDEELWTNVDYAIAAGENFLSRTHYAGDSLPFYNPWVGPDQFAGWLGAPLTLRPREYTSWATPFVERWSDYPEWLIDSTNRWWRLYGDLLKESVRAGRGKWITTFPDLHTGIDALSALRGPEGLLVDLLAEPDIVLQTMRRMTALWKEVVDFVWDILKDSGQGTTNWTGGWSEERFVCIGQNDFTCMIGPEMFETFCLPDTVECINHVDQTMYHLDGPAALRHLPQILAIERLHTVQWVHGNGQPPHSHWLDMLKQIQEAGKSVQIWYNLHYTSHVVDIMKEVETVCAVLDPTRLFIGADVTDPAQADAVVRHAQAVCRARRPTQVPR